MQFFKDKKTQKSVKLKENKENVYYEMHVV